MAVCAWLYVCVCVCERYVLNRDEMICRTHLRMQSLSMAG